MAVTGSANIPVMTYSSSVLTGVLVLSTTTTSITINRSGNAILGGTCYGVVDFAVIEATTADVITGEIGAGSGYLADPDYWFGAYARTNLSVWGSKFLYYPEGEGYTGAIGVATFQVESSAFCHTGNVCIGSGLFREFICSGYTGANGLGLVGSLFSTGECLVGSVIAGDADVTGVFGSGSVNVPLVVIGVGSIVLSGSGVAVRVISCSSNAVIGYINCEFSLLIGAFCDGTGEFELDNVEVGTGFSSISASGSAGITNIETGNENTYNSIFSNRFSSFDVRRYSRDRASGGS